jgi:hypothetical protein
VQILTQFDISIPRDFATYPISNEMYVFGETYKNLANSDHFQKQIICPCYGPFFSQNGKISPQYKKPWYMV